MRFKMLSLLMMFAVFSAQTVGAVAQVAAPIQQSAPVAGGTLTVPSGKMIPLTLVSPIKSRSTKVGDTVRAQVAFPVTAEGQIAIPAGTYVEGTVQSINAKKTKANAGGLQIHFTRLIFANGYTVALDAVNTSSNDRGLDFEVGPWQTSAGAGEGIGMGLASLPIPVPAPQPLLVGYAGGQTPTPAPTLPPLPGPPKAFLISISVVGALFIGFVVYLITAGHHASNADFVLYDAGYQFQMVPSVPVTIDTAQASAAAALAPQ